MVDACAAGSHNALGALRDLLIRIPDTLRVGREWADSGRYIACRAGVRLELSSFRAFRLIGFDPGPGAGVLRIVRSARLTMRGTSVHGDDTTRVDGSGSSTLRYAMDAGTGAVLDVSGSGSVDLSVRGRIRSERAQQTNSINISLRAQPPR
jgi:hypothetical protein